MTTAKNPYGKNYVDHYLQLDILRQLARSTGPVRFSELKEDGIENSLFMYHLNKLIRRGVVEKHDDKGFALTPKGADWINTTGITSLELKLLPRPLVQFVIRHETKLLLSVRNGQLGEHLNKYLLPGGLHKYGLTADETASQLLRNFYPSLEATPVFTSLAEMIVTKGEHTHHAISHIFSVDLPHETLPASDELFDFMWIDLAAITSKVEQFQDEPLLTQLASKLQAGALKTREKFITKADE